MGGDRGEVLQSDRLGEAAEVGRQDVADPGADGLGLGGDPEGALGGAVQRGERVLRLKEDVVVVALHGEERLAEGALRPRLELKPLAGVRLALSGPVELDHPVEMCGRAR